MVVARFLDRVCFRIGTWPIDDCFRWMRRGGTAWRGEGHVSVPSLFRIFVDEVLVREERT
jgi:hypothetical protein